MPETHVALLESPIGAIELIARDERLCSIRLCAEDAHATDSTAVLREAAAQIRAWFDGRLAMFDLPLETASSERGEAHRAAIAGIPYGETMSYGALARTIASGPRAIGQACRRNPFPIVIPCHRVIGSGGSIGYYSGGKGIVTKLWLLDHESKWRKDQAWAR
ncbi:methylated-DNA--[protein]-cysteine S-methyltransferase [Flavisphingomonas formosensis]|uniref:methylated-DNA--[protein]-cysteine S-methyltransferase n=1 Tax=Flavisphingomonas formosensis TaxID=861534 RepID=UPI0012FCD102|nr:methylated-DNA--[protein]-cysteine S-methyltransferase [Sphingomonas formosensis]